MISFMIPGCVSVAEASDDPEIRDAVLESDYIRTETLRRCLMIPSYRTKPIYWRNRYYDAIKAKVEAELREKKADNQDWRNRL